MHTEQLIRGGDHLLLMLPGALMTPQHMVQAGLFEELARRDLPLDLVAPNLHAEGADNQIALRTLETDWLMPARARYRRVWLGGISRGGQLALSCWAGQVGAIDGLCLLAPYAGGRLTTNAIVRAGGLEQWRACEDQMSDPDVRLWHWLQTPPKAVPMFMGYGDRDRFADGMGLLARHLPLERCEVIPGDHDWSAWLPLWRHFLDQGHFSVRP